MSSNELKMCTRCETRMQVPNSTYKQRPVKHVLRYHVCPNCGNRMKTIELYQQDFELLAFNNEKVYDFVQDGINKLFEEAKLIFKVHA